MKFTEAKLEQAFIGLLEIEGFPHCLGHTIARADSEVCGKPSISNSPIKACSNFASVNFIYCPSTILTELATLFS
jgi:hypothetical protein